jgi:hypothetical protein
MGVQVQSVDLSLEVPVIRGASDHGRIIGAQFDRRAVELDSRFVAGLLQKFAEETVGADATS